MIKFQIFTGHHCITSIIKDYHYHHECLFRFVWPSTKIIINRLKKFLIRISWISVFQLNGWQTTTGQIAQTKLSWRSRIYENNVLSPVAFSLMWRLETCPVQPIWSFWGICFWRIENQISMVGSLAWTVIRVAGEVRHVILAFRDSTAWTYLSI